MAYGLRDTTTTHIKSIKRSMAILKNRYGVEIDEIEEEIERLKS